MLGILVGAALAAARLPWVTRGGRGQAPPLRRRHSEEERRDDRVRRRWLSPHPAPLPGGEGEESRGQTARVFVRCRVSCGRAFVRSGGRRGRSGGGGLPRRPARGDGWRRR